MQLGLTAGRQAARQPGMQEGRQAGWLADKLQVILKISKFAVG